MEPNVAQIAETVWRNKPKGYFAVSCEDFVEKLKQAANSTPHNTYDQLVDVLSHAANKLKNNQVISDAR